MELEELYHERRHLKERIDNFFGDGGYKFYGDRGYQELLERLDGVEKRIKELIGRR